MVSCSIPLCSSGGADREHKADSLGERTLVARERGEEVEGD